MDSGNAVAIAASETWTCVLVVPEGVTGREGCIEECNGRETTGITREDGTGTGAFELGAVDADVGFANGVTATDSDFDNIFLNNPSMCCLSLFRWHYAARVEL